MKYIKRIDDIDPVTNLDKTISDKRAYDLYKHSRGNEYHVILTDEVEEPDKYSELIYLLRSGMAEDLFFIYLNNFGGYIHTGIALMNAIQSSNSRVTMVVTAPVYSMAAILALCGDELELEPHTFFMFHDYSNELAGKGNELALEIAHANAHFKQLITAVCVPFLSKEEINEICKGRDKYISYKDAKKRFAKIDDLGHNEDNADIEADLE